MDKSNVNHPIDDWNTDIGTLRNAIDEIDKRVMDLINRRLLLAAKIGRLKKQSRLRIVDGRREKEMITRLLDKNRGLLSEEGLRHIFMAIIAEGRKVQRTS